MRRLRGLEVSTRRDVELQMKEETLAGPLATADKRPRTVRRWHTERQAAANELNSCLSRSQRCFSRVSCSLDSGGSGSEGHVSALRMLSHRSA